METTKDLKPLTSRNSQAIIALEMVGLMFFFETGCQKLTSLLNRGPAEH